MMRKTCIYFLSISLIFIAACNDDDGNERIKAVTDLRAQPGENSITLFWNHPEGETLSYIDIDYSYAAENKSIRYEEISDTSGQTIIQVADENKEDVFYFTLTAWNTSGISSYPATIKSKAISMDMQSRMNGLLDSIEIEPIPGGVKIRWENTENIPYLIKVAYTDKDSHITYFDALTAYGEGVIDNLSSTEIIFTVEIVNEDGSGSSQSKDFTITPFSVYKLSKANWRIVSFSSQRAESGYGSAACLIDGTNKTSWWAGTTGAPQWVIVDLGAVARIEKFSLERTTGDTTNSAWDILFSVDNTPDPQEWMYEWHYYNTQEDSDLKIEFNRNYEGEQIYPVKEVIQGRYIKITGTRIGGGHTVHFGEFSVYGSYID